MSIQAVSWALAQRIEQPAVKLLLVAYANYADENLVCWPSQEQLAEDTSMSVRSVQRHVKALEAMGYLSKEERRSLNGTRITDLVQLIQQPDNLSGDNLSGDKSGSHHPPTVSGAYKAEPSKNRQTRGSARAKTGALPSLMSVEAGSPEFDAWIRHWKSLGQSVRFKSRQKALTVPTRYPPVEQPRASPEAAS